MKIDKQSDIPLYYQLKEILREEIESGVYKPNEALPPERNLCEKYDVSRATVRKAIGDLVNAGILKTERGRGTFVSPPKVEEDLLGFYSFTEEMKEKGYDTHSITINMEKNIASPRLRALFSLPLNSGNNEVFYILRLRHVNKEPFFIEKTHFPYYICPNLTLEKISKEPVFFKLLTSQGIKLKGAKKYIEPVLTDEYESNLLKIPKNSPALLLERHTLSEDNKVVAICKWIVRGDRCRHYLNI